MSNTINKENWLDFALSQLVKHGPEVLKIGPLCATKGVTKGSFYHHFNNRSAFIDALMEHWYQKMTVDFIAQANTEDSALKKLAKLDQVIAGSDIDAEMHIRAWALKEPSIVTHLAKIDAQRQAYLQQCFEELGMDNVLAKDVAMIAYAQFLGLQQIHPKPDTATILRLSGLASNQFFGEKL